MTSSAHQHIGQLSRVLGPFCAQSGLLQHAKHGAIDNQLYDERQTDQQPTYVYDSQFQALVDQPVATSQAHLDRFRCYLIKPPGSPNKFKVSLLP